MPALHCAMTRSGVETMKSGAPMQGRRNFPASLDAADIRGVLDRCICSVAFSGQELRALAQYTRRPPRQLRLLQNKEKQ